MKKTVARMVVFMLVLLGMSSIVGTGKAAMRDDVITPYYSYTVKVTSGLTIDENGSAVCKGSIRVRSNDSSVHTPSACASAANSTGKISASRVKTMTTYELTTAARNADTDAEAQLIFDELINRNASIADKSSAMYASRSAIIETYLSVISCSTSYKK